MSSIKFQDIEDFALVGGRERWHMGGFLERIFEGVVSLDKYLSLCQPEERAAIVATLGVKHAFELELITTVLTGQPLMVNGESWDLFELFLNTALVCGSDEVRLLARIHGSCEIFGYVLGEDRDWLAGLIENALGVGLMREETQGNGAGWRDVIDLLRARNDGPVVMSYSVTDDFPNRHEAGFGLLLETETEAEYENAADEAWYELSYEEQFKTHAKVLLEDKTLRMKPGNWATYRYGTGKSGLDLRKAIVEAAARSKP